MITYIDWVSSFMFYHKSLLLRLTNCKLFLDVSGVITYVGRAEADFCAPSGMREIAIVDSGHNTIFMRFFGESAYLLGDQLLSAEQNNAVIVASNMEVVHQSGKLIIIFLCTQI